MSQTINQEQRVKAEFPRFSPFFTPFIPRHPEF